MYCKFLCMFPLAARMALKGSSHAQTGFNALLPNLCVGRRLHERHVHVHMCVFAPVSQQVDFMQESSEDTTFDPSANVSGAAGLSYSRAPCINVQPCALQWFSLDPAWTMVHAT